MPAPSLNGLRTVKPPVGTHAAIRRSQSREHLAAAEHPLKSRNCHRRQTVVGLRNIAQPMTVLRDLGSKPGPHRCDDDSAHREPPLASIPNMLARRRGDRHRRPRQDPQDCCVFAQADRFPALRPLCRPGLDDFSQPPIGEDNDPRRAPRLLDIPLARSAGQAPLWSKSAPTKAVIDGLYVTSDALGATRASVTQVLVCHDSAKPALGSAATSATHATRSTRCRITVRCANVSERAAASGETRAPPIRHQRHV
jgi:hypothetical protein